MPAQIAKIVKRKPAKSKSTADNSVAATSKKVTVATSEQVRLRAYLRWEAAGKPAGDGVQFWLEAERELSGASGSHDGSTTGGNNSPTDLGHRFPQADMNHQC